MHKIKTAFDKKTWFFPRYQLGVGWDSSGTLYLWCDRQKIATMMKKVIQKDKKWLCMKLN